MSKRQESIKCQEVQLSNTIKICFVHLCIFASARVHVNVVMWFACVDPQGLSGHTHKHAFIKWFSAEIISWGWRVNVLLNLNSSLSCPSVFVCLVRLGLEYSSQPPNIISSIYTWIEQYNIWITLASCVLLCFLTWLHNTFLIAFACKLYRLTACYIVHSTCVKCKMLPIKVPCAPLSFHTFLSFSPPSFSSTLFLCSLLPF